MKIGVHEVEAEIGRGGVGRVFRARAPDGSLVAIKVLVERRPEVLARFAREARLLRELDAASGFVPLLDSGTHPELGPWIVMPYLPGGTLGTRLRLGPLAAADALALGVSLARALGRAHERGIVHRDVKPDNVLFADPGSAHERPLLADLGLAKHFGGSTLDARASLSLSKSGDFRGTAAYMPPEQLRDAKSAGPEADVFALGAVLYESLAGRPPFEAGSMIELAGRLEAGQFEPLAHVAPTVPRELAQVVERALAREPADRYPDGAALALALEDLDVAPASPGPARSLGRGLAVLAAGLALVAATGAAVFLARRPPAKRPAPSPSPTPLSPGPSLRPSAAPADDARERARALVVRAWARHHENDADAAIALAQQALDLDPTNAEAISISALVHLIREENVVAQGEIERAVALEPRLAVARVAHANLLLAQNLAGEAVNAATRAIDLDPRSTLGYLARAQAHGLLGEQEPALADLGHVVELDPQLAVARFLRSTYLERRGDWDGVIGDTTVLIEGKARLPDRTLATVRRRRAYARIQKTGDDRGAVEDAEAAAALAPDDAQTIFVRGLARSKVGRDQEALEDARTATALDPSSGDAWVLAGLSAYTLKRDREALDATQHVIDLVPEQDTAHHEALLVRGSSLRRLGREPEARAAFARCMEVAAKGSAAWRVAELKLRQSPGESVAPEHS